MHTSNNEAIPITKLYNFHMTQALKMRKSDTANLTSNALHKGAMRTVVGSFASYYMAFGYELSGNLIGSALTSRLCCNADCQKPSDT